MLAAGGAETVQMLGRLGYGPEVGAGPGAGPLEGGKIKGSVSPWRPTRGKRGCSSGSSTRSGSSSRSAAAFLEARLPDGLIAPHFQVCNSSHPGGRPGARPLELARAFQVPKTTMTHTLAGLGKRGLVDMRPNPGDGRSKRVWLYRCGPGLPRQGDRGDGPALR